VADNASSDEPQDKGSLHTFLIADVRGYTRFSDQNGDEAASRLARRFAAIVHDAVPPHGEVLELRGDEALCVFKSARAALWSAVELQRRFRERVDGEPALPLGVGIGLDAGEAVPTNGGYRGRALNVASRLCSLARPGEILASETVRNLAGSQDRARYAPRRPTRVKGVSERVRLVEVVPETALPPLPPPPKPKSPPPSRRSQMLWPALAGVGLLAALVTVLLLRGGDVGGSAQPVTVASDSVAVIDPSSNEVVDSIPIGEAPGPVVVSNGSVWVGNVKKNTLVRIDPETHRVVDEFGLGVTPDDLAYAAGSLWIVDSGCDFPCESAELRRRGPLTVTRFDPNRLAEDKTIELGPGGRVTLNVAGNDETVWVTNKNNSTVYRIDPLSEVVGAKIRVPDAGPVAAGPDAAWVVNTSSATLSRVDMTTDQVVSSLRIGTDPDAAAVSGTTVWVANFAPEAALWRVDTRFDQVRATVPLTGSPTIVRADEAGVWVGHYQRGAISRVNPETNKVAAILEIGRPVDGLAVGEGLVWATVR
jgi:YVTN family beta-propeller protein